MYKNQGIIYQLTELDPTTNHMIGTNGLAQH